MLEKALIENSKRKVLLVHPHAIPSKLNRCSKTITESINMFGFLYLQNRK